MADLVQNGTGVARGRVGRQGHPPAPRCVRYDPVTPRLGLLLAAGAVATAAALSQHVNGDVFLRGQWLEVRPRVAGVNAV